MKISPSRQAAFDVLFRIETEKAFSSALLPVVETSLSASDRGLCHELVLGCLRRQIYLDRIIDLLAGGKRLDIEVRITLRLGLYQFYFLQRIPDHSVVNESVNLIQRAKKTSAKGLVNAILRRAIREKPDLSFIDELDRISVETSHPRWLIEKWAADVGLEQAAKTAAAGNGRPPIAFRLSNIQRHDTVDDHDWRKSGFVPGCYLVEKYDVRIREYEDSGNIYFQDEASQLVAHAVDIPVGGSFLDVCAAPGGKTALIGQLSRDRIGLLVAGDLYESRLHFLRDNCHRQGVDLANILQYDAESELPLAENIFDTVLVDAPCSGTGTIRHNPEIRYFLQPDDFVHLSKKQLLILTNASKLVKKGGTLVYSTCSMEREENEEVVDAFLRQNLDFTPASEGAGSFVNGRGICSYMACP